MNAHQQCTGRINDNIIGPRRLKHPELTLSEKKKNGFHLIFSISIIDEIHLRSVLIDISVKKALSEKEQEYYVSIIFIGCLNLLNLPLRCIET